MHAPKRSLTATQRSGRIRGTQCGKVCATAPRHALEAALATQTTLALAMCIGTEPPPLMLAVVTPPARPNGCAGKP